MKVPYVNLGVQLDKDIDETLSNLKSILLSGQYILGKEVESFEHEISDYLNVEYAIGVANGTDALVLAMRALNIGRGDEVITAPNSYLASASSILLAGAKPVFADVGVDYNIDPKEIEKKINDRTKAIIPVHLTGNPANMDEIMAIAEEHGLYIIEDAAQAIGAKYRNNFVGSIGHVGCFSLHPLKNLGAAGDAGLITTNDKDVHEYLVKARNHGLKNRDECEFYSLNSRLDPIQASILRTKLTNLKDWNEKRRENAHRYMDRLEGVVTIPAIRAEDEAVFHAFVVLADNRDELRAYLENRGIETKIHYPVPIHKQEAFSTYVASTEKFPNTEDQMNRILSLPIYPELKNDQIDFVIDSILDFYK